MACRAAGGGRTGDNQPHGRGVVLIFGGSVSPSASPPLGNGDKSDPSTADAGPSTPHMASWERRWGPQTPAGPRGCAHGGCVRTCRRLVPWWPGGHVLILTDQLRVFCDRLRDAAKRGTPAPIQPATCPS